MADIDHASRAHALLSASGASRWMNCPPSARMEEDFPESSSVFAEEGTFAHELAETLLRLKSFTGNRTDKKPLEVYLEKLRSDDQFYSEEMEDYVLKYVDYVLAELLDSKKHTPDSVLEVEIKVDLTDWIPESFGTCDSSIVADKTLRTIDLKFGKGIRVSAEENPQLMLYSLGVLREYSLLYDIEEVVMCISQPRLDHISEFRISAADLQKWGEEQLKPSAKIAFEGGGSCKTGDWCKFCKAKPVCRTAHDDNLKVSTLDFYQDKLEDFEILAAYKKVKQVVDWAKSLEGYVKQKALDGKKWEGFKLVKGTSKRKWVSEDEAIKTIVKATNNKKSNLINTKLKGITEIEKLLGKVLFSELSEKIVIKPEGPPTLVPDSDKRPEILEDLKKDFD